MSMAFMQKPVMRDSVIAITRRIGYIGVDMHFHTEFSMDGTSKIESTLKRCRDEGVGVAITDHNEIGGAVKACKLRGEEFVIPGIELVCHWGEHLIVYFDKVEYLQRFYEVEIAKLKRINPYFLPIDIAKMLGVCKRYSCFTCTPHPFGPGVIGIMKGNAVSDELLAKIDMIEAINGACLNRENKKAIEWARAVNKGMSAGSDGHSTPQLGEVLCFARGGKVAEFLRSVKQAQSVCIGKGESIFTEIVHTLHKFVVETRHERGKLKELYKGRYHTELAYFKKKFRWREKAHHYLIHHGHIKDEQKEFMKKSLHYRHIYDKLSVGKGRDGTKRKMTTGVKIRGMKRRRGNKENA